MRQCRCFNSAFVGQPLNRKHIYFYVKVHAKLSGMMTYCIHTHSCDAISCHAPHLLSVGNEEIVLWHQGKHEGRQRCCWLGSVKQIAICQLSSVPPLPLSGAHCNYLVQDGKWKISLLIKWHFVLLSKWNFIVIFSRLVVGSKVSVSPYLLVSHLINKYCGILLFIGFRCL